jgi:hypothetical protein
MKKGEGGKVTKQKKGIRDDGDEDEEEEEEEEEVKEDEGRNKEEKHQPQSNIHLDPTKKPHSSFAPPLTSSSIAHLSPQTAHATSRSSTVTQMWPNPWGSVFPFW